MYHPHPKRKAGGSLSLQKDEVHLETMQNIHPTSDCIKNKGCHFLAYQQVVSKASKEMQEVRIEELSQQCKECLLIGH